MPAKVCGRGCVKAVSVHAVCQLCAAVEWLWLSKSVRARVVVARDLYMYICDSRAGTERRTTPRTWSRTRRGKGASERVAVINTLCSKPAEFFHPYFLKGRPDLLQHVRARKQRRTGCVTIIYRYAESRGRAAQTRIPMKKPCDSRPFTLPRLRRSSHPARRATRA